MLDKAKLLLDITNTNKDALLSLLIENATNEAMVYTTERNAAGILGVDMLSQADVTILNCYNTGCWISSQKSLNAFSGIIDAADTKTADRHP